MSTVETNKKRVVDKKRIIVVLFAILGIVIIGTSFALWQLTFTQSGTNVITTGCLKLTLTEDTDAINLTDATPTSDVDGKMLNPFTFTLENVCTTETAYVVNLETVSNGDKILSDNYVKVNLVSGGNELFLDKLLMGHINEEKVLEEASVAYKLYQGKLGNKEKVSFSLRLWMDEATEAIDEVMEASWQGKITVTASYIPPVDTKNMMVAMDVQTNEWGDYVLNNTYTQSGKYKEKLDKVVFQDKIAPYESADEVVDFSEAKDRSVLGYYVKDDLADENSKYTLYIQANGRIKVNPVASYYGLIAQSADERGNYYYNDKNYVDGLENLDTSLVTDMSYMFAFCNNDNLNLSNFDTSNVTNMKKLFYNVRKVTELNLGDKFYTSRVTNMESMFEDMYGLQKIDLGNNFDTSNVVSMEWMFKSYSQNNLTELNLGDKFDTSKVDNMQSMFYGLYNLNNIVYGSKFIHKTGANTSSMFINCPANKPTDPSWNGVF